MTSAVHHAFTSTTIADKMKLDVRHDNMKHTSGARYIRGLGGSIGEMSFMAYLTSSLTRCAPQGCVCRMSSPEIQLVRSYKEA